jgi:hypothetical protein
MGIVMKLKLKYEAVKRIPIKWDNEGNEIEWNEIPVLLWKFIDENGNLWNTETVIEATEGEAKEIILQSLESE